MGACGPALAPPHTVSSSCHPPNLTLPAPSRLMSSPETPSMLNICNVTISCHQRCHLTEQFLYSNTNLYQSEEGSRPETSPAHFPPQTLTAPLSCSSHFVYLLNIPATAVSRGFKLLPVFRWRRCLVGPGTGARLPDHLSCSRWPRACVALRSSQCVDRP